jgi:hypothetical protein
VSGLAVNRGDFKSEKRGDSGKRSNSGEENIGGLKKRIAG